MAETKEPKTETVAPATAATEDEEEVVVTPWEVKGKIDYDRLVKQFGVSRIRKDQLERMERLTGIPPHPWLRRDIFFAERALDQFLDAYEAGDPVFLYTGRGPSSGSLHLGHTIPFTFTAWMQKAFKCPVIIQMSDEEKCAFKNIPFQRVYEMGIENVKDIVCFGFDPELTFIFFNRDYRLSTPEYEVFTTDMRCITHAKEIQSIFGFDKTEGSPASVAMYDWPFYQSAAAFSLSYPHVFHGRKAHCMVPYAIDQDPYFRLARGVADRMNLIKPYSIMCQFMPPLTGTQGKMSSSTAAQSSIFLTDDAATIRSKVLTYAFSGGGGDGSMEDHRKYGGNTDVDISYQYLRYFWDDDARLAEVGAAFRRGEMSCSQMKELLIETIVAYVAEHRRRRALVTDDTLRQYMAKRPLPLHTRAVHVEATPAEAELYARLDAMHIAHRTKYHRAVENADQARELMLTIDGELVKTLLLKGDNTWFLVVAHMDTSVDMKVLRKTLAQKKLRFADAAAAQQLLACPRGGTSVFGLMHVPADQLPTLTVLLDKNLPPTADLCFHPFRMDATCIVSHKDTLAFINSFGVRVADL